MQLSDNGGNTSSSMRAYAKQAAQQIGWDEGLVYAQWSLETGNFTSSVFVKDNNLAGIKYVSPKNNPGSSPGSPANDGGVYAHFPNISAGVQGYVDFIKANSRYANVKTGKTLKDQATLLKQDGWATDSGYVSKVLAIAGNSGDKQVDQGNNAPGAEATNSTGVKDKVNKIVKSPVFWLVLLAGLVFKP